MSQTDALGGDMLNRREFAQALIALPFLPQRPAPVPAYDINGVRIGLETFSFHDLPPAGDPRLIPTIVGIRSRGVQFVNGHHRGAASGAIRRTAQHVRRDAQPQRRGARSRRRRGSCPTPDLERGRTVYVLNACHFCHGVDLTGAVMGATDLMHAPIVAADEDGDVIGRREI